jgi:hypothetical protein
MKRGFSNLGYVVAVGIFTTFAPLLSNSAYAQSSTSAGVATALSFARFVSSANREGLLPFVRAAESQARRERKAARGKIRKAVARKPIVRNQPGRLAQCAGGGTVVFQSNALFSRNKPHTFTYAGEALYSECLGVTGTHSTEISGRIVAKNILSASSIRSSLVASCGAAGLARIETDLRVDRVEGPKTSSAAINGQLTLMCDAGPYVTCSWNAVDLDDTAALAAGCSATGF